MADTIEAFVAKLQAQGVQAGRQEAEKLIAQAKAQAEEIVTKARKQADQTRAAAEKQAGATLDRAQTELKLAARDAILRLRDALARAVQAVLSAGAQATLSDPGFLRQAIGELVMNYAKADADCRGNIDVCVTPEARRQLVDWVLRELEQQVVSQTGCSVILKESLHQEGFEISLAGSTVEVTRESVVKTLSDLVSPAIQELLQAATAQEGK
jgi:F0F1-type ATP synthase membrane subunit b/b'